jgi:hypothetical protein
VSGAEQALESAMLAALSADAGVSAVLGEPLRVLDVASPAPAYPYLEIARHFSSQAGSAGFDASEHRVDLVVVSRFEGGANGAGAIAAVRAALGAAELLMEGWRCVLLVPAFTDTLHGGRGIWRSLLRIRAVVEAA